MHIRRIFVALTTFTLIYGCFSLFEFPGSLQFTTLISSTMPEAVELSTGNISTSAAAYKDEDYYASQEVVRAGIGSQQTDDYNGIPVGFTSEGYPYMGNPAATVTLVEFSDYLCPFCGRHFSQTAPSLIEEYVETGLVRLVFREYPIAQLHPTAHLGSIAALCAGEQGAHRFWAMHDELFARQSQWNSLPDPSDWLHGLAEELEVEMDLYQECIDSEKMQRVVEQGIVDAQALGLTGTPSFQFQVATLADSVEDSTQTDLEQDASAEEADTDKEPTFSVYTLVGAQPLPVFQEWLDALVAGNDPPVEAEPERPELPFWANEDGLQPDPDNPGHTLAGDQYKGNVDAPIVVVEFSDFQCPACARHSTDVQPILDRTFVLSDTQDANNIRWVFKHLPLREHEFAPVSAAAAECAAEQGAFWEMHDLLFETVDEWAGPTSEASLLDSFEVVFDDNESNDSESADEEAASSKSEDEKTSKPDIADVEEALTGLAESLDLDADVFQACLTSRQALERVLDDIYDAQGVVQQTPTFVILFEGQGSLLRGAREAEQFLGTLQGFVDRLDTPTSE